MSLTLRPMEPRDVPAVAAIDRLSFPTPWPQAAFRRELKRERAIYLVLLAPRHKARDARGGASGGWFRRLIGGQEDGCVIGYVGFRLEEGGGHITTIALRPGWRGQGLGDFLLLFALEMMAERGIDVVTLEMRPSNDVAYRLYRKFGFRIVQSRRRYYRDGEDAWVMAVSVDRQDYQRRLAKFRAAVDERLAQQGMEVGQIASEIL